MVETVTLNLLNVSRKILDLAPRITTIWLQEIVRSMEIPVTIPRDFAEKRTVLLARYLVEDVDQDMQNWALDMGEWLRSQEFPFSSILRTYQLYRNVFWRVLQPELQQWSLSPQEMHYLERQLGKAMDESVFWAVYHFEQMINKELVQKEETISYLHNDKLTMLGKIAANMAHELRNPLFAIEGFLKLISESTQEQAQLQTYIQVVMHEFENLHRQITGFLSFSKKPILDEIFKTVQVEQLLAEVETLITPRLVGENIRFEKQVHSCALACYEEGLKQVVVNLLNNAIDAVQNRTDKYIHVIATASDGWLYLSVENNGEMIPPDIVEILFQPFFTTKQNGTGIGLSICKNIIDKHNGTIHCDSNENRTRFVVSLPILSPEEAAVQAAVST
ncbi:signal transduction histidine kinase [Brevibacillus sp. CF112]|uniref:sensor histidine kinase n=1 Tax=Brevibacillus TaxID=55080 RepID=UPI000271D50A|nr:HAMP domain-containing sensor histidine kinase [Brevibacillus sp. CF112]EJL41965.1 signal transduction histidine kinase [Brevibacillus sp. CF112]